MAPLPRAPGPRIWGVWSGLKSPGSGCWSAGDDGDGPGPRTRGEGGREEPLGSGRRYVLGGGGGGRSRRRPKLDRPDCRGRGVGRPGRWAALRATLAPGPAARTHVRPLCDSERFRPRVLRGRPGPACVRRPRIPARGAPSPRSEEGAGTGTGTGRARAQDGGALGPRSGRALPTGAAAGTPRGSSRHRPEGGGSGAAGGAGEARARRRRPGQCELVTRLNVSARRRRALG